MCGINGFNWSNKKLIKEMNAAIKHRGPDDEGYYTDKRISLGSVRLAIVDLSSKGHMPMVSKDKNLIIIHNGEIYNYKEIGKGDSFKSRTDTEVILHAYKKWGTKCVKKFNGMWAFAIYDKEKDILFLSRDRFGIKPLYYYYSKNKFIFSSEIKAILRHDIERKTNDAIIFDYLFYNLVDHTEETFFKGIKRLMPGHNLIFNLKTGELKIEEYYNIKKRIKYKKRKLKQDDYKKLKELFLKSVQRRLISDVPVGSCLSGGIDSSSIVCAMRNLNKRKIIKTFSLSFPHENIDETKYQKIIIKRAQTKSYFTTPKPEEFLDDLNDFLLSQEEPVTGTSAYAQYRVMKLAHDNKMKVLLDGQGSDELFAGYHYYFSYYFKELLLKLKWIKLIKEILDYKKVNRSNKAIKFFIFLLLPYNFKLWINYKKNNFLDKDFISNFKNRKVKIRQWKNRTLNSALIESLIYYSIPHLLRHEDKNAMRFSIESRVPFLDHQLVEFALSKPPYFNINKGITKYGLRKALRKLVPTAILSRKDKIGFATPEDKWLRNKRIEREIRRIINSESFKKRKYWNSNKIKKMYDKHIQGKKNYGNEIWKCICLEKWLEIFKMEDN